MTTHLTRRGILKALGIGAAALALEPILEPQKKLWFVPSSAPVGSRIETLGTPALDRYIARTFKLQLDLAEEEDRDFREDLLRKLWHKVRSQKDLDTLRAAARTVETLYHGAEREKFMAEYDAGLIAQRRKSGAWRAWDPSEEYEADHAGNNMGTLLLA